MFRKKNRPENPYRFLPTTVDSFLSKESIKPVIKATLLANIQLAFADYRKENNTFRRQLKHLLFRNKTERAFAKKSEDFIKEPSNVQDMTFETIVALITDKNIPAQLKRHLSIAVYKTVALSEETLSFYQDNLDLAYSRLIGEIEVENNKEALIGDSESKRKALILKAIDMFAVYSTEKKRKEETQDVVAHWLDFIYLAFYRKLSDKLSTKHYTLEEIKEAILSVNEEAILDYKKKSKFRTWFIVNFKKEAFKAIEKEKKSRNLLNSLTVDDIYAYICNELRSPGEPNNTSLKTNNSPQNVIEEINKLVLVLRDSQSSPDIDLKLQETNKFLTKELGLNSIDAKNQTTKNISHHFLNIHFKAHSKLEDKKSLWLHLQPRDIDINNVKAVLEKEKEQNDLFIEQYGVIRLLGSLFAHCYLQADNKKVREVIAQIKPQKKQTKIDEHAPLLQIQISRKPVSAPPTYKSRVGLRNGFFPGFNEEKNRDGKSKTAPSTPRGRKSSSSSQSETKRFWVFPFFKKAEERTPLLNGSKSRVKAPRRAV